MIEDEFLWIGKSALRHRDGIDTLRVTAIKPSPKGPSIRYDHDPIGPALPTNFGPAPTGPTAAEILEGVARMLRCRWRAGTPKVIAPADDAWRLGIEARHPGMYEAGGPHSWSGWRFLWEAGAEWIDEVGRPHDWETAQTKEKFGSARWYAHGTLTDTHHAIVRTVEIVSAFTCEYCGAPGQIRKGPWVKVCCDAHSQGRKAFSDDHD